METEIHHEGHPRLCPPKLPRLSHLGLALTSHEDPPLDQVTSLEQALATVTRRSFTTLHIHQLQLLTPHTQYYSHSILCLPGADMPLSQTIQ